MDAQRPKKQTISLAITNGSESHQNGQQETLEAIKEQFQKQGWHVIVVPSAKDELENNGVVPRPGHEYEYNKQLLQYAMAKEQTFRSLAETTPVNTAILYDGGLPDYIAQIEPSEKEQLLNELGIEHQDLHSAYDAVIHLETQTYNTNTIDQKDERTIEQERKYDADIQDEYYDHENTFVVHADGISSHKRLQKTCDLVTDVVNRKIFGDKAPALPTHIIRQLTENLPPELAKEKEQELRSRTIESVKNQEPIHYDGSYKSFREIQLRESTLENTPQYSPRSQKSDFDITD